jgi:hypothetical protein
VKRKQNSNEDRRERWEETREGSRKEEEGIKKENYIYSGARYYVGTEG